MRIDKLSLVLFTHVALWGSSSILIQAFVPLLPRGGKKYHVAHGSVSSSALWTSAVDETTTTVTTVDNIVDTKNMMMPDMSLLDDAQLSSSVGLAEMTKILLDEETHPIGTLSYDVLDSVFPVIYAWAKTSCPTGAITVERILNRIEQEAHADNYKAVGLLTAKEYTVAIDAWARSQHFEAAINAEAILNKMEALALSLDDPHLSPTRISYNAVMNAWRNQNSPERAAAIMERMEQNPDVVPITNDFNVLLATHARRGDARKAEEVLAQMVERCKDKSDENADDGEPCECAPDLISYNCVLDAWSRSDEVGAAERADSILSTLRTQYETGESTIGPDAFSYSTVAAAWARSGKPDAVERAEAILAVAEAQGLANEPYVYNAILAGWAVSTKQGAAFKAEEVLEKMERDGLANLVSYNTVIKAWKNSNEPDKAQRAEALLTRMEELHALDPDSDIEPEVVTYTSVIDCFAKSKQRGSAEKAESLLERMFELSKEGNTALKPNTITINCVLDALAKCGEKGAADRAERLLTQMEETSCEGYLDRVHLNTITYSTVIDAFSKSGMPDSAQRAEEIFQRMETAYKQGNEDAKPNVRSFNAVINAWVQSGDPGSVQRAEAILQRMEDLYATDKGDIKPTVVSYSIVMNGWAKSGAPDAVQKTEEVFNRMKAMYESGNHEARPNLFSYVTLIDAIVRSGKKSAPQQAEEILHHLFAQYNDGNEDAKPNARVITTVMDCWGKSGASNAGEKAEALLNMMVGMYEKERDESFKPDQVSFNTAINAWAKSRQFGKAYRARSILQKMIAMYEAGTISAKPNVFIYTAVMNACAYTIGDDASKQEALQIAADTFRELCNSSYGKPNHVTYDTYLTVFRNLLPEGKKRTSSVVSVFKKCCQDSQVSGMVIRRLESALTKNQLRDLFPSALSETGKIQIDKLPAKWKRNVEEKSRKPRVGSGRAPNVVPRRVRKE